MPKIIAESHHVISGVAEVAAQNDDAEWGFYLVFSFLCGTSVTSTLFLYPQVVADYIKNGFIGCQARVVYFDNQKVAVLVKP